MYTNIQQAISAVESAYPSLFTKEDVIKLLNQIDLESSTAVSKNGIDIEDLTETVESVFNNYDTSDMVSYDDIELSINYDNRIEIEIENVETDDLQERVIDAIREFFKKNS
jgi:hypothetical protein